MIDFVTLLLTNMVAGLVILAGYLLKGLDSDDARPWIPGFGMVGLIAVVFGGYMTMTWPLPGPYNSAFGEMSVLLGTIFLATAVSLARGWPLYVVACYAFFAGVAAVLLGARIIDLGMTQKPAMSGVGFILSGLGGVFAAPTLLWLRSNRPFRFLAAGVLLAAALIWAATAYGAFWMHMEGFQTWQPLTMRGPAPPGS